MFGRSLWIALPGSWATRSTSCCQRHPGCVRRLRAEAEGACGHVAGGLILASGDPNDTRVKVGPGAIGGIDLLDEGEVAGGKRPAVRLVCVDAPHPDPE
jgi:hypothetical protein